MKISSSLTRYLIGILLVALGVLLLLDNTTVFGVDWSLFATYWPVLLIVWGLWWLFSGGLRFRIWPIILILVGVGFQLSELGLWQWNVSQLWPAIIVIVGLYLLLGRRGRRGFRRRRNANSPVASGSSARPGGRSSVSSGSTWNGVHVFGGVQDRVTAQDFRGGEAVAVFGGIDLDLREAALAEGRADLEVTAIFGGVQLRVPPGWRVNLRNVTLLGGTEQSRQQPAPEDTTGELTITGTVMFGGLEITD